MKELLLAGAVILGIKDLKEISLTLTSIYAEQHVELRLVNANLVAIQDELRSIEDRELSEIGHETSQINSHLSDR